MTRASDPTGGSQPVAYLSQVVCGPFSKSGLTRSTARTLALPPLRF